MLPSKGWYIVFKQAVNSDELKANVMVTPDVFLYRDIIWTMLNSVFWDDRLKISVLDILALVAQAEGHEFKSRPLILIVNNGTNCTELGLQISGIHVATTVWPVSGQGDWMDHIRCLAGSTIKTRTDTEGIWWSLKDNFHQLPIIPYAVGTP